MRTCLSQLCRRASYISTRSVTYQNGRIHIFIRAWLTLPNMLDIGNDVQSINRVVQGGEVTHSAELYCGAGLKIQSLKSDLY